ncbi:MAG: hypothetical protein ACYDHU_02215 [Acidimicrobiales bacterium]
MADAELVLTGEEWVAAMNANTRPPTPTDVTITWDGRAINT